MSLSPEQLDIIADKYVAELYQNMETEVINDIARRVQKMGRYTETAELMAKSMREQGYSTGKIQADVMKVLNADPDYQKAIAENTKAYKKEIKDIIDETVAEAKKSGNKLIAEAGTMAWNDDLQMWKEHDIDLKKDNQLAQLYKSFQKQTANQLVNITRTTCIKDQYGNTDIMDRFRKEMDLAVLKVTTGTWSYEQALGDCIKRMSATGMKVKYNNGKTMQADSYARMCVRTACSQLAGKVTEMNMDKTGQDLVYVSAHSGARPEHALWQGQVYYWSKFNPVKGYDYFVDATNYGDVTGLKGANCSHEFYPYWEGTAIPKFKEPDPVKVDGKTYTKYEATQQQRAMERGIRASKRELEATKAVGGDTTIIQKKLNQQLNAYADFSNKAGLRVQDGRIGNFNTRTRNLKNVVNKVAPAAKKAATTVKNAVKYAGSKVSEFFQKLAPDAYKGLVDLVDKCSNDDLRNVWAKYEDQIKIGSLTHTGTQHHLNGSIFIDIKKNILGSDYEKPYSTTFHESGHCIDYLGRGLGTGHGNALSTTYKDGAFAKKIEEEISGHIDALDKELKAEFAAHKDDYQYLKDHNLVTYKQRSDYEYWGKTNLRYSKEITYEAFTRKMQAKYSLMEYADISDMIEGATMGKVKLGVGHGAKYWKDRKWGEYNDGLAKEAFAEMTAATMAQPESLKCIKEMVPESYEMYCDMLKLLL